jgi:hypothetical protein
VKITSSEIAMASSHSHLQKYEKSERLRTWIDTPDATVPLSQRDPEHGQAITDSVLLKACRHPPSHVLLIISFLCSRR